MSRLHTDTSLLRGGAPHAYFSHGLLEAPLLEGAAGERGPGGCSALLLNSLCCPYCMLSRQAAAAGDDVFYTSVDSGAGQQNYSHISAGDARLGSSGEDGANDGCVASCCRRLPDSMHWTCLSAVAIDVASIVVGVLWTETLVGVWLSGLMMQALYTRYLVRRRLGLAVQTAQDITASLLLVPCAIAQQHVEIELRRGRGMAFSDYEGLICGDFHVRKPMPSSME